jgi:hypothetical protein
MRRLAALALALASGALNAQDKPPARPDFTPLEFLVGSCWMGTFPDGKATDEHCFEWVYDRMFIRDRHVVRGGPPYQGESLYRWDAATKQIAYWYWASPGLVVTGTLEDTPDGMVFPSRYDTPKGEVQIKALWRRTGDDSYRVSQSQRAAGESEWKPLWTMELRRKK